MTSKTIVLRWKADFLERVPSLFAPNQNPTQDQVRVAELERMVGRLTMELESAKSLTALDLTRTQKRQVMQMLAAAYPIALLCRVLELPRSTLSYQPVDRDEADLRQPLEAAAQQLPTYGSRRLSQQVRRAPYRLMACRTRVRQLKGE